MRPASFPRPPRGRAGRLVALALAALAASLVSERDPQERASGARARGDAERAGEAERAVDAGEAQPDARGVGAARSR